MRETETNIPTFLVHEFMAFSLLSSTNLFYFHAQLPLSNSQANIYCPISAIFYFPPYVWKWYHVIWLGISSAIRFQYPSTSLYSKQCLPKLHKVRFPCKNNFSLFESQYLWEINHCISEYITWVGKCYTSVRYSVRCVASLHYAALNVLFLLYAFLLPHYLLDSVATVPELLSSFTGTWKHIRSLR